MSIIYFFPPRVACWWEHVNYIRTVPSPSHAGDNWFALWALLCFALLAPASATARTFFHVDLLGIENAFPITSFLQSLFLSSIRRFYFQSNLIPSSSFFHFFFFRCFLAVFLLLLFFWKSDAQMHIMGLRLVQSFPIFFVFLFFCFVIPALPPALTHLQFKTPPTREPW